VCKLRTPITEPVSFFQCYCCGRRFLVYICGLSGFSTVAGKFQPILLLGRSFIEAITKFPKPIIAAVNGPAIGFGVTALPLTDVVYAADNSTFLTPFSRIGIVPEACSSYTFPKLMGYAKVLLQSLRWRCVECAIHHDRDVHEEQHPYICGANKQ